MSSADNYHLCVGDSFTICNEFGKHLHVIVAEASPDDESMLMLVYLSSAKSHSKHIDRTTIIHPGEHPFVDNISWVRYQNILIQNRNIVEGAVVEYYGKVDDHLLERIQSGIERSDKVRSDYQELYRQWHMDQLYRNFYR